jgi:toxin FitB
VRYLIDTNILSELAKPQCSPLLLDWLGRQADDELFISTITVGEIWRGILELRPSHQKRQLETWFAGPEGPLSLFGGRILLFDVRAAMEWAKIMAEGTAAGQPRSAIDMFIAAIAMANQCIVVTANEHHFRGAVEFVNPTRDRA